MASPFFCANKKMSYRRDYRPGVGSACQLKMTETTAQHMLVTQVLAQLILFCFFIFSTLVITLFPLSPVKAGKISVITVSLSVS